MQDCIVSTVRCSLKKIDALSGLLTDVPQNFLFVLGFHTYKNMVAPASICALGECLADVNQPIAKRTHAAFYLRTDGSPEAVDAICHALKNKEDSALLRHELAYILGQMQDNRACALLSTILSDEGDDCMVRHESAEALGAIGDPQSIGILEKYADDPAPEVSDTCRLALDLLKWRNKAQGNNR